MKKLLALFPKANDDISPPPWRHRLVLLFAFAALLAALIAASPMRGTGDTGEYLIQADKLGHLQAPNVDPSEYQRYNEWFAGIGGYIGITVALDGTDGPYEFNHFWFYAAFVAPLLRITEFLGFNPIRAFTAVNCAFLLASLWVVSRRLHWLPTALLFAGPVIWWADKAHTEAFTFALLAAAFSLFRARPAIAMVLIGVAATQNFPIGVAAGGVFLYAILQDRTRLRSLQFWAATVIAAALCVFNPLYFKFTIGEFSPQSINGGLEPRFPLVQEYLATLFDLNIGLVIGAPLIVVVGLAALGYVLGNWKRADWSALILAAACLVFFLFSFSQTGNFNHGATPSMTRYGLWLIPMFVIVFIEAQRLGAGKAIIGRFTSSNGATVAAYSLVMASVLLSIVSFSPRIADGLHKPTTVASWVWNNHPAWDDPLPEVFFERLQADEGGATPIATPNCAKVLVVMGEWPESCADQRPAEIPETCATTYTPGCYANRTDEGYDFVPQRSVPGYSVGAVTVEDSDARLQAAAS